MKVKASELIAHIEKAHVSGLINEVVLDDHFRFHVTDDAKMVLSISNIGLGESGCGSIGVFDLALFSKTIAFAAARMGGMDKELEFVVEGNHLVFKLTKGELKFLLSDVGAVGSTVNNLDDVLARVSEAPAIELPVKKSDFDSVTEAISLYTPDWLNIVVSGGKVNILVGAKVQHLWTDCLGETDSKTEFTLKFHPSVFTKVLSVLPYDTGVDMELREGMPMVFVSDEYTFLIAPMAE
jgi:hypothetical protein